MHSDNLWAGLSFQFVGKTHDFVQRYMQVSAEFWPSLTCCFPDLSCCIRNVTKWSHFVIMLVATFAILIIYHEVYETVRSLRQRRGDRLGAVQRKLPPVQCLGREGRQISYDFMSEHGGAGNIGYINMDGYLSEAHAGLLLIHNLSQAALLAMSC